jgi:hypothetical protein
MSVAASGARGQRPLSATAVDHLIGGRDHRNPVTCRRAVSTRSEIEVAPWPDAQDTVLEAEGARLYVEPEMLRVLDHKVLDADTTAGEPHFAIFEQAEGRRSAARRAGPHGFEHPARGRYRIGEDLALPDPDHGPTVCLERGRDLAVPLHRPAELCRPPFRSSRELILETG